MGEELVCPVCGIVGEKEVVEFRPGRNPVATDFTPQALGSYLGSVEATGRERSSRGFSTSHSNYGYLKTLSDFVGRDDGTLFECVRMVERVCENLSLPNVVMARAVIIARKMLGPRNERHRTTIAAVSAVAIVVSCRVGRVASVSTKEVIEAHRALGRTLKVSSMIRLFLESGIRLEPREAEDYVPRVVARLSVSRLAGQPMSPAYVREIRILATEILGKVPEEMKAGHRPGALAATAVYAADLVLAAREGRSRRITQRDVALSGDAAEYTVREQYREIFAPTLGRLAEQRTPVLPPGR